MHTAEHSQTQRLAWFFISGVSRTIRIPSPCSYSMVARQSSHRLHCINQSCRCSTGRGLLSSANIQVYKSWAPSSSQWGRVLKRNELLKWLSICLSGDTTSPRKMARAPNTHNSPRCVSMQIVLQFRSHVIWALLYLQEYRYSLLANGQFWTNLTYKELSIRQIPLCFDAASEADTVYAKHSLFKKTSLFERLGVVT